MYTLPTNKLREIFGTFGKFDRDYSITMFGRARRAVTARGE